MKERGDGWHRIGLEEWGKATQNLHYDIHHNDEVVYDEDNPYNGDFMSVAEALWVIDLFPKADYLRYVYNYQESQSDTHFVLGRRSLEWLKSVAGLSAESPKMQLTMIFLDIPDCGPEGNLKYKVFVHRLQDDWYVVDFRETEHDFEERPIFKCDQISGIENLVESILKGSPHGGLYFDESWS